MDKNSQKRWADFNIELCTGKTMNRLVSFSSPNTRLHWGHNTSILNKDVAFRYYDLLQFELFKTNENIYKILFCGHKSFSQHTNYFAGQI